MRVNQPGTSLSRLTVLPAVVLTLLFAAACGGSKLAGTFVGTADFYGAGYNDESAANVTATLTSLSSLEYSLTFDEKSPVRCKLRLINKYLEDIPTDNDGELSVRASEGQSSCEMRDKSGQMQTAKIIEVSGGRVPDGYVNFIIKLETTPSAFNFKYQGWPK